MLEEARLAYVALRADDLTASRRTPSGRWLDNGYAFFPEARDDRVTWSYDHADSGWHVAFTPGMRALDVVTGDGRGAAARRPADARRRRRGAGQGSRAGRAVVRPTVSRSVTGGWGNASYLALSGATVLAEEGQRLGLVDRVVPAGEVLDEALAVAAEFAANPSPQLRMIKELLSQNGSDTDFTAIQQREIAALEQAYRTPEHREAVQAFLEKRPPNFTTSRGSRAARR